MRACRWRVLVVTLLVLGAGEVRADDASSSDAIFRAQRFFEQGDFRSAAEEYRTIYKQTRDAAYQIIARKGATYYAVASGLMLITRAILRNQSTVLSVSSLIDGTYGLQDVCLSLPTIVNRRGIKSVLELDLSTDELSKLRHSADVLKDTIRKLAL